MASNQRCFVDGLDHDHTNCKTEQSGTKVGTNINRSDSTYAIQCTAVTSMICPLISEQCNTLSKHYAILYMTCSTGVHAALRQHCEAPDLLACCYLVHCLLAVGSSATSKLIHCYYTTSPDLTSSLPFLDWGQLRLMVCQVELQQCSYVFVCIGYLRQHYPLWPAA